jgi:hypothetical protein
MLLIENDPWPKLTLVVSLEAIFLSTFVMIGQNRQAGFQQAKADHDFNQQEMELKRNTELTEAIHELTLEIHTMLRPSPAQIRPRRSRAISRISQSKHAAVIVDAAPTDGLATRSRRPPAPPAPPIRQAPSGVPWSRDGGDCGADACPNRPGGLRLCPNY